MKKEVYKIAEGSKLPIITAVCAAIILFFEFCTINIIGGEFMFSYRFPMHFGGSLFDMTESLIVVCIPVLMLVFTLLYGKRNLKMLSWPVAVFILRVLVKTGYLSVYEGTFTLQDTWLDLTVYTLLLAVFLLTVFGKITTKWWLVGICTLFLVMEIVKLFVPAVSYAFVVGTSVYLSTFLSYSLFFVGYGALGMAMEKKNE